MILSRSFAPILLFSIALASGSLWLARPVTRDVGHVVKPIVPAPPQEPVAPPRLPPEPERESVELRAELERVETGVRSELSNVEASKIDVAAIEEQIAKLRTELQELQAKQSTFDVPRADQSATIHGLETDVNDRKEELVRLDEQLEEIKQVTPKSNFVLPKIVRAIEPVNKLPVLVDLYQNHITPVTKEYFHFPMFSLKNVFVVKRSKLGETIAEAKSPDSNFARFLAKITPDEYVSCLLNPDSFQAFYAVRDMVRKRQIEIGWDPSDTSNGAIKIANVALGKESDKNKIAIPEVVR